MYAALSGATGNHKLTGASRRSYYGRAFRWTLGSMPAWEGKSSVMEEKLQESRRDGLRS